MYTRSSVSLEYVLVSVSVKESGITIDPTFDTVEMAFVAEKATPGPSDWNAGSWETDSSQLPTVYYARCLVGPGGVITLTPQIWDCWIRVTDNPEKPVLAAGQLRVI